MPCGAPANIAFLRQRFEQLKDIPAFAEMRWTEDRQDLSEWMPLVMEGRDPNQAVAATRIERGTDVDFGALTRAYLLPLQSSGALTVQYGTEVSNLKRQRRSNMTEGDWRVITKGPSGRREVRAPFVFLGAGGGALPLLQRSGIPEGDDFAGFPVSGLWLVCNDAALAEQQRAKVYGKAAVGAPPMSVPHLDTRWMDGRRSLLFGPFAGFSSKFLKQGSLLDLPNSVRPSNLLPMLQVGATNIELVRYLINQLRQSSEQRFRCASGFSANSAAGRLEFVGGGSAGADHQTQQGGWSPATRHGGGGCEGWLIGRVVGGIARGQYGGDDHVGGAAALLPRTARQCGMAGTTHGIATQFLQRSQEFDMPGSAEGDEGAQRWPAGPQPLISVITA